MSMVFFINGNLVGISNKTISEAIGVFPLSTQRVVETLEDEGFVTRKRTGVILPQTNTSISQNPHEQIVNIIKNFADRKVDLKNKNFYGMKDQRNACGLLIVIEYRYN
jgi:DNA-binding transcriptional regulator YhcF (GntR family)